MIAYFFLIFMLVGTYFLMNLFVGVIFLRFTENQIEARRHQKIKGMILTDNQRKWIEMQRMIVMIKPDLKTGPPQSKFRLFCYRIIMWGGEGVKFDICMMVTIVCNIIIMAMTYEGSSVIYDKVLNAINYVFTAIFMAESIVKLIALGPKKYFISSWNRFDFLVVLASIIDVVFDLVGGNLSYFRVAPQLASAFRVLRVVRVFKLIKSFTGLQQIIQTLLFTLPSLLNVMALLLLVFFMFSVLGVFLFSSITKGSVIGSSTNFWTFSSALTTLFRCSTGENWWTIMMDTIQPTLCQDGTSNCGSRNFILLIFQE